MIKGVNLGCGDWFSHPEWKGLDQVAGENLTEKTILPFKDNSLDYAYSSHFFEHVNNETAERLFAEVHRCLKPGGKLWFVVPDASLFLQKYRDKDVAWFQSLGFAGRKEWPRFGLDSTVENIILHFLSNYDDHRSGERRRGPPLIDAEAFSKKVNSATDEECFDWIMSFIPKSQPGIVYGHINCWNQRKMKSFLEKAGFKKAFKGSHGNSSIKDANHFDDFANRSHYSLYFTAEKEEK